MQHKNKYGWPISEVHHHAIEAIQSLAREEGWDQAGRAFADAVQDAWKERYLESNGLEEASNGVEIEDYVPLPDWMKAINLDHHEYFRTKDRQHFVLVAHEYEFRMSWFMHIQRLCAEYGLVWHISAGSWHFPSASVLIEIAEDLKDRNFLSWQGSLSNKGE